jgi:hypothetical protein
MSPFNRQIFHSLSELLSDTSFVEAQALLRGIAVDKEKYRHARAVLVESRIIQLVPHGFLSSRSYISLASCFSETKEVNLFSRDANLNIGFWVDRDVEAIQSLGEHDFHIVWSPACWLEYLRPSCEVFVGSYEHTTMSLEQIFSSGLISSEGITTRPVLERILQLGL